MKQKNFSLILFSVLLLWAPQALADFITASGNYNGASDVTDQAIHLAQFDSNLGTLRSVSFQLTATMTTSAFAENDGDFYAGWDKLDYNLSLAGTGAYNDLAVYASNAPVRIVGTGIPDGSFSLSESSRIVGQPSWTYSGPTLMATDSFSRSAVADFIGSGDLTFLLTTLNIDTLYVAGAQTGGVPPSHFGLSTFIDASVDVTYEYAPVPIPGAAWLLCSGMIGIVGLRKRLKS